MDKEINVYKDIYNKGLDKQAMMEDVKSSGLTFHVLAYLILKALSIAVFLLSPLLLFIPDIIKNQIILLAIILDFWYTKNIAGRTMVGLRYWIFFDQEGNEQWKFQCRINQDYVNKTASRIFWTCLAIAFVSWVVLSFFNIIKFKIANIALCLSAVITLGVNIYAFYKCSSAQKTKVNELMSNIGEEMTKKLLNGSLVTFL